MTLRIEPLEDVPAGNVFHHDLTNVGASLDIVTLEREKHASIMLMGDAFSQHEISFRVCDQTTGKRWRVILERDE